MSFVSHAGRVLGGRYKIDAHLADGGMGSVWTAQHLTLGTRVAVKLMSVEATHRTDLRARFEQEAKAVARLRHPNIVQVLDYGTDEEDSPYIVMELLDGVDLLGTRDVARTWPLAEIATLVSQVASGLGAAHRAGLIHRDVKPANIFLAPSGARGEILAKVIDFGIAKWAENKDILTGANVALGSPSFMSPEQIRGQKLDERVDAWALAVVTFILATGELPFVGKNGPDIAKQIVLGNRRKITPPTPSVEALERFFTRAFASDPQNRFRSVEELAGEFILVAGAPSPLAIGARSIERSKRGPDDNVTKKVALSASEMAAAEVSGAAGRDETTTNELVRSAVTAPSGTRGAGEAEDLESTETDDRLADGRVNPSAGAGGRSRSSE